MAGRLRAFNTFGTNANLRESLTEFAREGRGLATSMAPAAWPRISALASGREGVRAVALEKVVAQCLSTAGETLRVRSDESQEREALAEACRRLPPDSPFFASRGYPGFARRVASTLAELRSWRMNAEGLENLKVEDRWLAQKLRSLAELDRSLRQTLQSVSREVAEDQVERCLMANLGDESFRLWVYAGAEFSPLWADWLRWLLSQGCDVWLVMDGHPKQPELFRGAKRLAENLRATPRSIGRANGLAENLFSDQPTLDPDLDLHILSAGDALSECEWAFRLLGKEVQNGMGWDQAALYVRNLDAYAPLLASAAARFEVPLRMGTQGRLAENSLIRFLLALTEKACSEDPSALGPLAESSYVGSDKAEAERQRNLLTVAASGPEPWAEVRNRLDPTTPSDRWLFDAVRWHEKGQLPDVGLFEWVAEWESLAQAPWLADTLDQANPSQARDRSALLALSRALMERAAVSGATAAPLVASEFIRAVAELAESVEYAIPAAESGLLVASQSQAIGGARILVVLGMVEGAFPRRRSEDPILSDSERARIDLARPSSEPLWNSRDVAAAERDEWLRLCAAAESDLVLMYPQVDDERDNTPAFYLLEIERIVGARIDKVDLPTARLAPRLQECVFGADVRLAKALQQQPIAPTAPELASPVARQPLTGMPEDGVSPSEIRDALLCPFRYAFRRRLRLFGNRSESRWWRLRQLAQASGLAQSPSREAALNALDRALDAELESIAAELSPAEKQLLPAGGRKLNRELVDREFTARELWPRDEGTATPGAAFGEAGTAAELPLDAGKLKLRGQWTSVSDMKGYAVGQLYGLRKLPLEKKLEQVEDVDLAEIGAHLFSLARRRPEVALEVDTLGGERVLFVLPRRPEVELPSQVEKKVRVVDLGEKRPFYDRVKRVLSKAVRTIEAGEIAATPGDHCGGCDYGEICRFAKDWGETPESPFEPESDEND